jgi:hypothetical protein
MDKRTRIGKRERAVTKRGNAFLRWVRLKHEAKTARQAEAGIEATEQPGINAATQEALIRQAAIDWFYYSRYGYRRISKIWRSG